MGLVDFLILYITQLSYVAILILLLVGSVGIPFPEEIILLVAGYLASLGYMHLGGAILICFVGVVVGDLIGYGIGHHGGRLLKRLLSKEKFKRIERHFERHGSRTIFVSRFLAGIRVWFPIAAGAAKMPVREFLLWDGLAALIWTPVVVLIGYWFGAFLPRIVGWVKKVDIVLGIAFAVFLVVLLIIVVKRNAIKRKIEGLRHDFFRKPRKGETPYEVLVFGDVEGNAQRVYSKRRDKDGKISIFIEFLRDGQEYKCLHSRQWLKLSSYHDLVETWTKKLGKPKKH